MGCTHSTSAANAAAGKDGKRIDVIDETKTMAFGGITVRYAYLSQSGYYPGEPDKANQDSYVVAHDFAGRETDAFFGVFDGHGPEGDKCSQFVRDNLPSSLAKSASDADADLNMSIKEAHMKCNRNLHRNKKIDDNWSGTTSISMLLSGGDRYIKVMNVGDSRAVIGSCAPDGTKEKQQLVATFLSKDQTPWRREERKRIIDRGGRILTEDQVFGVNKGQDDVWESQRNIGDGEKVLGEEIDESGQPPRVFSKFGDYPGLSVTRSIGDKILADEGVLDAEPEISSRQLTSEDKVVFIASDGVWEFITNQEVIDMCSKFSDPLEACKAIASRSYELWMKNDTRSDDITMICIFIDEVSET